MNEWDGCLKKIEGNIKPELLNQLINNLPSYGIFYDDSLLAANTYGGYLMPYKHNIHVKIGEDLVKTSSRFIISVNHKQSDTEKFHTICHELGHLLCRHIYYNERARRHLNIKEEEFEAETVAWLVCKRMGISNPSEQYLAIYAKESQIPLCSLDLIMKAVTEIEEMIRFEMSIKTGKWYQTDKVFKDFVDDVFKKQKRKK
jgi:Zn-dependent peptidase ImmA (M78 family)